jgi:hypothetical protein
MEGNIMKTLAFVSSVLLLTAPAWAIVTISCTDEGNGVCAVRYDATREEPNLVRAFALDIVVSDGAKIIDINDSVNTDYHLYPGSIVISNGVVTSYGTAKADPNIFADTLGLEPNSMTIEMGSAYSPATGFTSPNAPATSGILFTFTVDAGCFVYISENAARGGIVMEDGSSPASNLPCVCPWWPPPCMKPTHPDYQTWVELGMPDCWCYAHHCQGDADGRQQFGQYWVFTDDLNIFKANFAKTAGQMTADGICCDIDHKEQFGQYRVFTDDLDIFKVNFAKTEAQMTPPGECDKTDYIFWKTP